MRAAQTALDVTSHNIANAGVEGYSRQRVNLSSRPAHLRGGVILDGGVNIEGVSRISDRWVARHIRNQLTEQSYHEALLGRLKDVEAVLDDTADAGIANALGGLFNSLAALADKPEDHGVRGDVLSAAKVLSSRFATASSRITAIARENRLELDYVVERINQNLEAVASLNGQISAGMAGRDNVGDLQDARDRVIAELSRDLGVSVTLTDDERFATVSLDGKSLVLDVVAQRISLNGGGVYLEGTTTLLPVDDGRLGAMMELRDTTLPSYSADLDTLAATLIARFNTQHRAGTGLNGSTNLDLFSGTGAATMGVALTDPSDVAASATGAPGDHGNARALQALRTTPLLGPAGGLTFEEYHSDLIAALGSEVASSDSLFDGLSRLVSELENSRDAVHSVSLDEEMTNLIRFQQAYGAAARIVSAVDELMQTVINLGR